MPFENTTSPFFFSPFPWEIKGDRSPKWKTLKSNRLHTQAISPPFFFSEKQHVETILIDVGDGDITRIESGKLK